MRGILWRTALRKGLLGGNRPWFYLFAALGAARVVRRLAGNVPEKVYSEELRPGQALIITHYADQTLGEVR
ncbi:MAG TPA: hypothetical protein VHN98_02920 [Acidimicrobiales bacterium]|nr:hypothetical protein [Acidimicrobiales bacterium]